MTAGARVWQVRPQMRRWFTTASAVTGTTRLLDGSGAARSVTFGTHR